MESTTLQIFIQYSLDNAPGFGIFNDSQLIAHSSQPRLRQGKVGYLRYYLDTAHVKSRYLHLHHNLYQFVIVYTVFRKLDGFIRIDI